VELSGAQGQAPSLTRIYLTRSKRMAKRCSLFDDAVSDEARRLMRLTPGLCGENRRELRSVLVRWPEGRMKAERQGRVRLHKGKPQHNFC
jgi:hypothetical protein